MKVYNKLVRDKIPYIVEEDGNKCGIVVLENDKEYLHELKVKMQEELDEFFYTDEEGQLGELADLIEVIHSYVKAKGFTIHELEKLRQEKRIERGSFDNRIFLLYVDKL